MDLAKLVAQRGGKLPKKPPKRLPKQALPVSLERAYAKVLWPIVRAMYLAYAPVIAELKGKMPGDDETKGRVDALLLERSYRTDAPPSNLPPGFKKKLDAAARKVGRSIDRKRLSTFLEKHAKSTDRWNNQEFAKQASAAVGVDILTNNPKLQAQTKAFVRTNVDLITKVGADVKARVEKVVYESIEKGRSYEALRDRLQDSEGIDRRRATLIARDQTGKLYGEINATRQTEIGIKKFIWRTSNDNRVRDEHSELEKESESIGGFEYADPPSEGLPGEPIQCRCYAEPVFDMLADL